MQSIHNITINKTQEYKPMHLEAWQSYLDVMFKVARLFPTCHILCHVRIPWFQSLAKIRFSVQVRLSVYAYTRKYVCVSIFSVHVTFTNKQKLSEWKAEKSRTQHASKRCHRRKDTSQSTTGVRTRIVSLLLSDFTLSWDVVILLLLTFLDQWFRAVTCAWNYW